MGSMKRFHSLFYCLMSMMFMTIVLCSSVVRAQSTLEAVRQAGVLRCGLAQDLFPFSYEEYGQYKGFDVDFCRAVASVVLSDPNAIDVVYTSFQERFIRLHDGDFDILFSTTTWTFERDVNDTYKMNFTTPIFYDGQGLLAHIRGKDNTFIRSLEDIDNPSVCVIQGTTSERNLADFFEFKGLPYIAIIFRESYQAAQAFEQRLCDISSNDRSSLAGDRSTYDNPEEFILLDDVLSKEPLAAAVREGDDQWFDVVQWTIFALIQAEEWGVTSSNVRTVLQSTTYAQLQYMLQGREGVMRKLGLDNDAMARMIEAVGNYGEIYDRYFGPNAATPIARGLNRLWTQGGILYSAPFHP